MAKVTPEKARAFPWIVESPAGVVPGVVFSCLSRDVIEGSAPRVQIRIESESEDCSRLTLHDTEHRNSPTLVEDLTVHMRPDEDPTEQVTGVACAIYWSWWRMLVAKGEKKPFFAGSDRPDAVGCVIAELDRATRKSGRFASAHEGYAVILEELDELWDAIKSKDKTGEDQANEAVQVAAMALQYLHDICGYDLLIEQSALPGGDPNA